MGKKKDATIPGYVEPGVMLLVMARIGRDGSGRAVIGDVGRPRGLPTQENIAAVRDYGDSLRAKANFVARWIKRAEARLGQTRGARDAKAKG